MFPEYFFFRCLIIRSITYFYREHSEIVELRCLADKLIYRVMYIPEKLSGSRRRLRIEHPEHSFRPEQLIVLVRSFGNSVGIDEQGRAFLKFKLVLRIFLVLSYSDDKSVLVFRAPLKTYCRSGVPAFSRQIVQKFCRNTGVFQEIYVQYDG